MWQQKYECSIMTLEGALEGDLSIPKDAKAIVLFAHGSGSGRHSTRNQHIAQTLNDAGLATLLVDLLTPEEMEIDLKTRHLRFDVELLARRLSAVTEWLVQEPKTKDLRIGYFGSSTGAAAALIAAAKPNNNNNAVKAIVSRGGRPDLADSKGVLQHVTAPTLLIVGGNDTPVVGMNKNALKQLVHAEAKELVIIPGATHLFEEPGKMEEVAKVAVEWFECYLLKNGKKFNNKYSAKASRFLSAFKERSALQIKFKDRLAAGDMLASILDRYKNEQGVTVIGIPRGGVIVADIVARKLDADFDIVVPRKLRAPDNSENAIGAVMSDGSIYLDTRLVELLKVSNEYIDMEKMEQKKEIDRRIALYRSKPEEYKIKDRTVILVDDGAATGATIIAAARWARKEKPRHLIIALPVASKQAVELLKEEADDIEVIRSSYDFESVEQFYQDFSIIADDQVIQIIKKHLS